MKFVADENFPRPALKALRDAGWDVFSVAEECPGISDEEVAGFRRTRFPARAFGRKRSRPVPAYT